MKRFRTLVVATVVIAALAMPAVALAETDYVTKTTDGVKWTSGLSLIARSDRKYGYAGASVNASKTCYSLLALVQGSFYYYKITNHGAAFSEYFRVFDSGNSRSVMATGKTFYPPSGYYLNGVTAQSSCMMQATKTSAQRWTNISDGEFLPAP